jgi:hypothetical protein
VLSRSLLLQKSRSLLHHNLLDRRPRQHTLHPRVVLGIRAGDIELLLAHDRRHDLVPGDEHQISIRALVADQVLAAFERGVEHAYHTLDLFYVARAGERQLWLIERVPCCLPVIWTLSRDLTGGVSVGKVETSRSHMVHPRQEGHKHLPGMPAIVFLCTIREFCHS